MKEEDMSRPKVVLYVGASVDGRITFGTHSTMFDAYKEPELYGMLCSGGEWEDFRNKIFDIHHPDMYLEGCNMLVSELDELIKLPVYEGEKDYLYEDFLPDEILKRHGRKTWTSVVDGRGRFRNGYTAQCDDPETNMIHLTSRAAPAEYLAFLRSRNLPYMIEGKEHVDLPKMLRKLRDQLDVRCIATSSGGKLSGALIRASLLDEINILLGPIIVGGFTVPTLFASPEPKWPDIPPNKLKLIECKQLENDKLWLRYKVVYD
jgi:riboflavin biosynthesis pyrimidine reductase